MKHKWKEKNLWRKHRIFITREYCTRVIQTLKAILLQFFFVKCASSFQKNEWAARSFFWHFIIENLRKREIQRRQSKRGDTKIRSCEWNFLGNLYAKYKMLNKMLRMGFESWVTRQWITTLAHVPKEKRLGVREKEKKMAIARR